jgi:hypothetical protein
MRDPSSYTRPCQHGYQRRDADAPPAGRRYRVYRFGLTFHETA